MPFVMKYVVLPSHSIINLCGPEHDPVGWTPEKIEARKKKTQERLSKYPTRPFFEKLEESILDEGFRNPILVTAGLFSPQYKQVDKLFNFISFMKRIPPDRIHEAENLLTCERIGGSRLYIAQKHDLEVPCIVNDFNDLVDGKELKTVNEVKQHIKDLPMKLEITQKGLMMNALPHIHMEKK